jgi:kynurenine formamidase
MSGKWLPILVDWRAQTMPKESTRRDLLARAFGLGAASLAPQWGVAQTSSKYPRNLTKTDIERWMKELSNWGRWGKEDQAGTINLIGPAKRKQAAGLVKEGLSVSMSLDADLPNAPPISTGETSRLGTGPVPAATPPPRRYTWEHVMRNNGAGRQEGYVVDSITVSFHGNSTTHLDTLSHYIWNGFIYNGFPGSSVTSWGATKNDVMPYKDGIFTRGVLVDMPVLKGVPYLGDDEAIYPEDLEAWEKKARLRIESGDAVFVRTGRWRRVSEKGPLNQRVPGLYASCAKWLKERDIALLGSDAVQDVSPSRVDGVNQPVHQLFLVAVGTPLFDNCDLEAISQVANRFRRWTFLFTVASLRVPGATGSPANPIATF